MTYWKRLYILTLFNEITWNLYMCIGVSHDTKHVNPQVILRDDGKGNSRFINDNYIITIFTFALAYNLSYNNIMH